MSSPTTPDELTTFGRYQLLRALPAGGVGEVYEGLNPLTGQHVAIKLFPAFQDQGRSNRFQAETRAAMQLAHPNIVTVHEFGEVNDVAFLVTELVNGMELANYFGDSHAFGPPFAVEESVRIVMQLLDAVEYAHRNGVVHRAIRPANVFLTAGRKVKLGDFGYAGMGNCSIAGKPAIMAPEQIACHRAGPAADFFNTGVILYQLLTGACPFAGRNLESLQQSVLNDKPPAPSIVNPEVHPAFDRVIARALAKRPEQRYNDALAMQADLLRALEGEDVAMPALPLLPAVRPVARSQGAGAEANTFSTIFQSR